VATLVHDPYGPDRRPLRLRQGKNSIGRARDNTISLGHASVSRRHAELSLIEGRAYFKDLDSSNHSFVNDRRVELAELHDGDRVRLGSLELLFSTDEPVGGDPVIHAGIAPTPADEPLMMLAAMHPQGTPSKPPPVLDHAEQLAQLLRQAESRARWERFLGDGCLKGLTAEEPPIPAVAEVTVLCAAIAGFDALRARLDPMQTIALQRRYFHSLVEGIVLPQHGLLTRWANDALVAVWGVPGHTDGKAAHAVGAAAAMQQATAADSDGNGSDASSGLTACALPGLSLRIGISTGPAVIGNIGSERRPCFDPSGPAPELAKRIAALTAPGEILIAEDTAKALPAGRFRLEPHKTPLDDPARFPVNLYEIRW
jgi:class 3 adenylate cyclase